jgi:hypothetical protein
MNDLLELTAQDHHDRYKRMFDARTDKEQKAAVHRTLVHAIDAGLAEPGVKRMENVQAGNEASDAASEFATLEKAALWDGLQHYRQHTGEYHQMALDMAPDQRLPVAPQPPVTVEQPHSLK